MDFHRGACLHREMEKAKEARAPVENQGLDSRERTRVRRCSGFNVHEMRAVGELLRSGTRKTQRPSRPFGMTTGNVGSSSARPFRLLAPRSARRVSNEPS